MGALRAGAQVDVLLEDHVSSMPEAFTQPHVLEVLQNVYHRNKLFRLGILTCRGKEALNDFQSELLGLAPPEAKLIFANMNEFKAGPDFKILVLPTEGPI